MSAKEMLLREIENLDEPRIHALCEMARAMASTNGAVKPEKGFLASLMEIQIEAPADFSENFELYASGEKSFDDIR